MQTVYLSDLHLEMDNPTTVVTEIPPKKAPPFIGRLTSVYLRAEPLPDRFTIAGIQ